MQMRKIEKMKANFGHIIFLIIDTIQLLALFFFIV